MAADDPVLNCVLEVCCTSGPQQLMALANYLAADVGGSSEEAVKYAACILRHFDLAEKGTLVSFKASIARLARGRSHQP